MDKPSHGRASEYFHNQSTIKSTDNNQRRINKINDTMATKYEEPRTSNRYPNELNNRFDMNRNEKIDNYKNVGQQRDTDRQKNPFRSSRNKFPKPIGNMMGKSSDQLYESKSIKDETNFEKNSMANWKKYDDRPPEPVILPSNIELLPPRLQKQYFLKHGIDPDILNKPHSFKEQPHQTYRNQKDRIRDNSALRNSPERHRQQPQQQQMQQQQQQQSWYEYDRGPSIDKDRNYGGYGDPRKMDKQLYKMDKSNVTQSSRNKGTDLNHFSSSGRSVVYDKSSVDYHNIRITKKMDWSDDLDNREPRSRRNSTNISRGDDYGSNRYENDKESYRNYDQNSLRNRSRDRDYKNYKYDEKRVNNFQTMSMDTKLRIDETAKKCTPGLIRLSPVEPETKSLEIQLLHELFLKEIKYNSLYARPQWYDIEEALCKPQTKNLVKRLDGIDSGMQSLIGSGDFLQNWHYVVERRKHLQDLFEQFLTYEMKMCREANIEQHFWKILYYNFFELFKSFKASLPNDVPHTYCNEKAIELVEDGLVFFEKMIETLEHAYKFKLNDYIGINAGTVIKGLKFLSLAIISAQKICLFMGDLYRYREQFLNTKNFGKAKQWYVKAQQLVPANGKPYNQLAVLSLYTKRKFDAVYYHTRSLTSSNPIHSAKESLKVLFDEIRKKYETSQLKHEKRRKEFKQRSGDPLRRETWIHPEGGPKIYRTAFLKTWRESILSSDEDECSSMDSLELSKRFTTSYLHVHGKLITKIGMESFMQCATQMLKEFRILLRHSPVVLTTERLIQLMALNMFAIENASTSGSIGRNRSEIQGFALSLSLTMFGIVLEKFLFIVNSFKDDILDTSENKKTDSVNSLGIEIMQLSEDAKVILPAIKIWCDWLVRHIQLWKSPPACIDNLSSRNPWKSLDTLGAIIEKTKIDDEILSTHQTEDHSPVRLPEDISLLGFTPLLSNVEAMRVFCSPDEDMDYVHNSLRLKAISSSIHFIRSHCDLASLQKEISANNLLIKASNDSDLLLESFSDNDDDDFDISPNKGPDKSTTMEFNELPLATATDEKSAEIRKLLRRKDELERRHKMQEKQNQRLQEILNQRPILLNIEVRPKYIVPDTNCYIDFLDQIKLISNVYPLYYIVVPLVVINELEGLSRGTKSNVQNQSSSSSSTFEQQIGTNNLQTTTIGKENNPSTDPQHNVKVATSAQLALTFLKSKDPVIKFCTTKGSILNSAVFTIENDKCDKISNDDKILLTASNLCKSHIDEQRGEFQYIVREVVLLTTDRNLRVKALSQNVPVREIPDFIKWSGLGM